MKRDPWSRRKNLFSTKPPTLDKKSKRKWVILPVLWLALKRTCTLLGAMVLLSSISLGVMLSGLMKDKPIILPDKMVLYIDFDGGIAETPYPASFADPFAAGGMTLRRFVDTLDAAAKDVRIKGIYARLDNGGYQLAQIQEMRAAIKNFRKSGKFAYIYSSSYGEAGNLGAYYLAAAFDERWMQPMGIVAMPGVNAQMPFLRGVLDKIGVEPQILQRKEYKSAMENLTHSRMSVPNREMIEVLIGDIAKTLEKDLAQDIPATKGKFSALVDRGLFTAPEALKAGLLTHVDYADVLTERINKDVTGDPKGADMFYINISDYAQHSETPDIGVGQSAHDKSGIGLIYAVGAIVDSVDGGSGSPAGFMDGGTVAAADQIAGALIEASGDPGIDIVVLRVDSPGGSPVASETILRAVQQVQKQGKKVIVSMGATAASGGYWISAYADRIFVMPTTITGSIGVVGGKMSTKALWEKLGVNWDGVSWGKNAGIWSMNTPFSASERERVSAMLDNVYDNFIARVAKGRKMSPQAVEKIAKGRVWSGARAVENGLADEFGGLGEALDYAAMQVGATGYHDTHVTILPQPLTPFEQFLELLQGQVTAGSMMTMFGVQAQVIEVLRPLAGQVFMASDPQKYAVYNAIEVK